VPKHLEWGIGGGDFEELRQEVIRNGFSRVLTLPRPEQQCTSLGELAQRRLEDRDREAQEEGDRTTLLEKVDVFALLLYTGTDVQRDMHESHRLRCDFGRWRVFRVNLMAAVSKLSREQGCTGWRYSGESPMWMVEAGVVNGENGWAFDILRDEKTAVASHADHGTWDAEPIVLYHGSQERIFDDRAVSQQLRDADFTRLRRSGDTLSVATLERQSVSANNQRNAPLEAPFKVPYCDFLSSSLSLDVAKGFLDGHNHENHAHEYTISAPPLVQYNM
jgi:hypothetical protein